MYSKAYSDRRYSVVSGEGENISVPPRYGGVRFMKTARSDGREGSFEKNAVPMAKINAEKISEGVEGSPFREARAADTMEKAVSDHAAEAAEAAEIDEAAEAAEAIAVRKKGSPLSELLKSVGEDDILIIALILIIAAEKGEGSREIILLLALLLCFR